MTPELKAQMVRIARDRGYSLEQLMDPDTMRGLMKDALLALDKLVTEVLEGRTWRSKGIVSEIAALTYLEVRGRTMARQVGKAFEYAD